MESEALEVASELCKLVGQPDLFVWLGVAPDASAEDCRTALRAQRQRLQSMQANPKYKDVARFVLKSQAALEAVLADPTAYSASVATAKEAEHLPTLELMLDGVLADGVISAAEETFVREVAVQLGIGDARFKEVLKERAAARGVVLRGSTGRTDPGGGAPPSAAQGWWDSAFTRLLLGLMPAGQGRVVDVACGLAWSALTLLPERPEWQFLGLEPDEQRCTLARRAALGSPIGGQVRLEVGRATSIPVSDGEADIVLAAMALQGASLVGPALREIHRALRPGGSVLVVEPDRFAQQFWFDGVLDEVNDTFRALCRAVDAAIGVRRGTAEAPDRSGIALGPRMPRLLVQTGFNAGRVAVHPIHGSQVETMGTFARRVRTHLASMAATGKLPPEHPAVVTAHAAVDRAEQDIGTEAVALSSHLLPLFVAVATTPNRATS